MSNVLIIVENLPVPLDRRVWQEAKALVADGYGVFVICPKAGKYTEAYEEREGIKIYRHGLPFEGDGVIGYVGEYFFAWIFEFYLAVKIALKYRIDVIQACNPPDNIFLIAILLRTITGLKFVFDHHDPFAELFALKFPKQPILKVLVSWFERHSLLSADQVITTSEELRRMAVNRYAVPPERIALVRSGFDLKRVPDVTPDPALKRGRQHLALYIGVMGAQDGLNLLLEAAAAVVYEHGRTDIQFVLAGGGPDMAAMQALCTKLRLDDFVDFSGYLEGAALYKLLATAEIGLVPDPKNDFNDKLSMNKILEYMAFGLPVVQFDLNEGRFLGADAALYAADNDPRDMARLIIRLMDDPAERARMGEIGRGRVREQFSWETQERLYLDAYGKLLSGSKDRKPSTGKRIFGFLPASGTLDETADQILRRRRTGDDGVGLVVTPNIHHIALLRTNKSFRQAYDNAATILCDGWPVYSYARKRGNDVRFVTGCDLIAQIFDRVSALPDHRICLVVDTEDTERAVAKWSSTPGFTSSVLTMVPKLGFIDDTIWCDEAVARIQAFSPTMLIMCVGAPQSEVFIDRYRAQLPPCWALCVGQAVKVKLGLVRRAPGVVRWLRAEWLWRLVHEPLRLTPRYLHAITGFVLSVFNDMRSSKGHSNPNPFQDQSGRN